jgi:hypothetical protein
MDIDSPRGARRAALMKSGRLTIDRALALGLDAVYRRLSAVFSRPAPGDFIHMLQSEQALEITSICDWGNCANHPLVWRFDNRQNWLPTCHTCTAIPDPDGHAFASNRKNYRESTDEDSE